MSADDDVLEAAAADGDAGAVLPNAALTSAMERVGTTRDQVRALCQQHFGVARFGDLVDPNKHHPDVDQWRLVCMVDPETTGPYGHTMAPFDGLDGGAAP